MPGTRERLIAEMAAIYRGPIIWGEDLMTAVGAARRRIAASIERMDATGPARALRSPALQQVIVLMAIVVVWQLASGRLVNAYYLSTPAAVLGEIARWIADGTLWPHLGATLATTLSGF